MTTVEHGDIHPQGFFPGEKTGSAGVPKNESKGLEPQYPLSLTRLNEVIYGEVSPEHRWAIENVKNLNWKKTHWNIDSDLLRRRAGQALAAGVPGFVEFGNFKALMFHPHEESMRTVNVAKGREKDQVASLVTTREHIDSIFDWTKLQGGLTKEDVIRTMDAFYDRKKETNPYAEFAGPFGFRGPAADHIPDHLTSIDPDTGLRTVQIIAPGYDCPSNDVIVEALRKMKSRSEDQPNYLAITSANPSRHRTGRDEPAHYLRRGIQQEFYDYPPGFFIMGHRDELGEESVRAEYLRHEPNSTTILDFSKAVQDDKGVSSIHMARHGSLSDEDTIEVLSNLGLKLIIDDTARPNLALREYDEDFLKTPDTSNQHHHNSESRSRPRHGILLFRR